MIDSASSVSLTVTTSPAAPSGRSNSVIIRGSTKIGSRPGANRAPATQWWA